MGTVAAAQPVPVTLVQLGNDGMGSPGPTLPITLYGGRLRATLAAIGMIVSSPTPTCCAASGWCRLRRTGRSLTAYSCRWSDLCERGHASAAVQELVAGPVVDPISRSPAVAMRSWAGVTREVRVALAFKMVCQGLARGAGRSL